MSKDSIMGMKDIKKNKEMLLEQTKGQVVGYSEFVKQTESSKYRILMKRVLANLKMAKEDFEKGRENITFEIKGSKETQFGKKVERKDIYVLEDADKIKQSIIDYFNEEAPLKTKDKSVKSEFLNLLEESIDKIDVKKEVSFSFKSAQISIKLEPFSQFVEIFGSKGAKIDLSK